MIERLKSEEYLVTDKLNFVDTANLHGLFDKVAYKSNIILVGPKGVAKTLSFVSWASKNKAHVVTYDCSEDVRRSNLLGTFVLRGADTPFILGPVPTAIEIANEVGSCILCLEEINALTPQAQKILNPIADFRKRVEIPEAGQVFRLNSEAKLWIVGTMNFSIYGGVYELNEDLKSRFRMATLGYPKEEQKILKTVCPSSDKTLVDNLITLARETRQQELNYSLSTRDLIQILEDVVNCDLETALYLSAGRFEGQDQEYYKSRIKSIFGILLK